jgi:hypothetical protein
MSRWFGNQRSTAELVLRPQSPHSEPTGKPDDVQTSHGRTLCIGRSQNLTDRKITKVLVLRERKKNLKEKRNSHTFAIRVRPLLPSWRRRRLGVPRLPSVLARPRTAALSSLLRRFVLVLPWWVVVYGRRRGGSCSCSPFLSRVEAR